MLNKYPYTDYNELNLDWFLTEFKKLYDAWLQMQQNNAQMVIKYDNMVLQFGTLTETVNTFTAFVTNYFDNLDVQQEVNNKLDQMVLDGTLQPLLAPYVASGLPDVVTDQLPGVVTTQLPDEVQTQLPGVVADQIDAAVAPEVPGAVTSWLNDNVNPVGSAVVVDASLSIAGAAADAKATGDIKTSLKSLYLLDLTQYDQIKGNLGGSGTWNNISNNYKHIVVPVKAGDLVEIDIDPNYYPVNFAVVKTYTEPSNGDTIDFSADPNWNNRKQLVYTTEYIFKVPSDANYLIYQLVSGGNTYYPLSFKINGYDFINNANKEMRRENSEITDTIFNADILSLDNMKEYYGFLSIATWQNFGGTYKSIIIPCKASASLKITAGNNAVRYGVLKDVTIPILYETIPYSTETGWTSFKTVSANSIATETLPADAKCLVITVLENNVDTTPVSIVIDGVDHMETVRQNIQHRLTEEQMDVYVEQEINKIYSDPLSFNPDTWISGTWQGNVGESIYAYSSNARRCTNNIVNTSPVHIVSDGTYLFSIWELDENDIITYYRNYSVNPIFLPAGTRFRLAIQNASDSTLDISGVSNESINAAVQVINETISDIVEPGVEWCAMGDSITQGYVSYLDSDNNPTSRVDKNKVWVTLMARRNGWHLNNIGVGGTGWINPGGLGADPAYILAAQTDFTPYDLVTLAYGINDWKGNETTGDITDSSVSPTTIIGAMKSTIESIIASNPFCKIIVILPLNCVGYSFNYGDESTNYGLGYRFSNSGTLEEFVQAMIQVCQYYGIEYVDMTHASIVNRKNLLDCLTDGVHPNENTHAVMARELGAKINFR